MTMSFDLYWSFRSPYSYLVTPRIAALVRDHEVQCVVRPVYPHAIRAPELNAARDATWIHYFKTDIVRTAEFLGLPLAWPRPDPVATDATGQALETQPYIHRLTRLGVAAAEAGRGIEFLDEVSRLLWHPATEDWSQQSLLDEAVTRAGLSLSELDERVARDSDHFEAEIQANQQAELAAGHWGVPVMVLKGEPFFGQDRFDQLVWRLKREGLMRREE